MGAPPATFAAGTRARSGSFVDASSGASLHLPASALEKTSRSATLVRLEATYGRSLT